MQAGVKARKGVIWSRSLTDKQMKHRKGVTLMSASD